MKKFILNHFEELTPFGILFRVTILIVFIVAFEKNVLPGFLFGFFYLLLMLTMQNVAIRRKVEK
jgi:hypothetical protein